jgi:hypothetical protein
VQLIVKPLGAIVILGIFAGGIALVASRNKAAVSKAANASSEHVSTATRPETELSVTGANAPGWQVGADGKSAEKVALGTENEAFVLPETPFATESGQFCVRVRASNLGKTAPYPKYGIRLNGTDTTDNLAAWIDPPSGVLTTVGKVGGFLFDWHTSPLPNGFDMTKDHVLKIRWSEEGKVWTFMVDDDEAGLQQKVLARRMTPARAALLAHDVQAVYSDLRLR